MITFVGGSPFSTSFASRHSWRVRQSDNYHHVDHDFCNFEDDNDDNVEDFDDEDGDREHDNKADFSWRILGWKMMLGILIIMIILKIKMMANGVVLTMI